MKTIQQEIEEFRLSVSEFSKDDIPGGIHRLIREGFDVVGRVVNLSDTPSDLDELSAGIEQVAGLAMDKLLANNPVLRRTAKGILPFAVPGLVSTASQYTGTADEFVEKYVKPVLGRWEETIHSVRVAL